MSWQGCPDHKGRINNTLHRCAHCAAEAAATDQKAQAEALRAQIPPHRRHGPDWRARRATAQRDLSDVRARADLEKGPEQ